MKLGLYVNVLLTADSAWKVAGAAPLYLRQSKPLDARSKAEVLKLSFSSIRRLPIGKLILNVEASPEYAPALGDILTHARSCFPDAEIVHETKRPTSLEAWRASTQFAARFFGQGLPIVCFFNHDHIFVDYRIDPFINSVQGVFSHPSQADAFLMYSHAPETISMVYDGRAYQTRLRHVPGGFHDFSLPIPAGNSLYKTIQRNRIDSLFVTTESGLRKMWSHAVASGDYIPRPDWPSSVTFVDADFEVYLSVREYFRHFDGYGHVTTLRGGLALDLSGFGSGSFRAAHHLPEAFGGVSAGAAEGDLNAEADSYAEIFFENYGVAARDALFAQLVDKGAEKSGKRVLEELFQLFLQAYLESPGELTHRTDAQRRDLPVLVAHRIFALATVFQRDLIADCSYWHPVFAAGRPDLTFERGARAWLKSLWPRLVRKLS